MIYLFVGIRECRVVCKLFRQSVGGQTAEAHYRFEDLVALYHSRRQDPQTLEKVVKDGDRFVHEYLLDQADLPTTVLTLLAHHAANKNLRTTAAKRLQTGNTMR